MSFDLQYRYNSRKPFGELSIFPFFSAILIVVYLVVYLYFRTALPEKWSVDSGKILDILNYGSGSDIDNSFAATAAFFAVIGIKNLDLFTVGVSTVWLVVATHGIQTPRDFATRWLLIAPCIMLNMFAPSKETIVLIVTLLIAMPAIYFRVQRMVLFATFVICYLVYGIFVRKYYLLIFALLPLIYYLWQARRSTKLIAFVLILFGVLASPSSVVQTLQSPRDTSNSYAQSMGSDNRTAFYNIVPPTSGPNFLVNYIYAGALLLAPIVFFHTPSDAFMQIVVIAVIVLLFKSKKRLRSKNDDSISRFFSALILSHVLVQIIFEPDLGSFTRHLSSIFLYIFAIEITRSSARRQ